MKILLTGLPKSGKTTLLLNLLEGIRSKRGVVAREERKDGRRVAFTLVDETGNQALLASVAKTTDYPVGRFFVDVDSLEDFCRHLFDFAPKNFLYIDEIGQMQRHSANFKKLLTAYLNSDNDYLGTVSMVYEHPIIREVTSRPDILVCRITPENRAILQDILSIAIANRQLFNNLQLREKQVLLNLARHYLEKERYISLRKLFHNALRYIAEQRVSRDGPASYTVGGDHNNHLISLTDDSSYRCDCDLFNGLNQYENQAGECSHIQAVKIIFPK